MDNKFSDIITKQNNHQFIYGYNSSMRNELFKKINREYPILFDQDSAMVVYVDEIGLPEIINNNVFDDKSKLNFINSEFIYFSILYNIILKAKVNNDDINDRFKFLYEVLNQYGINSDYDKIRNLDDLIGMLYQSKEFYKKIYMEYKTYGTISSGIDDVAMPFMRLDRVIPILKKAFNNNSYFVVIMDNNKEKISLESIKVINSLVGEGNNRNISLKIVTDPGDWQTYKDVNNQYVENYDVVELDDANMQHIKKKIIYFRRII